MLSWGQASPYDTKVVLNSVEVTARSALDRIAGWLLIISVAGVAFCAAGVSLLAQRAAKTVSVLTRAVGLIGHGFPDWRIALKRGDELGRLAQSLGELQQALAEDAGDRQEDT